MAMNWLMLYTILWRECVGIEPTRPLFEATTVLKTAEHTSAHSLPVDYSGEPRRTRHNLRLGVEPAIPTVEAVKRSPDHHQSGLVGLEIRAQFLECLGLRGERRMAER